MEKEQNEHWGLMGFIVLGLLLISVFIPDFSTVSFTLAVGLIGFMIYLKMMDKLPAFEWKDYDIILSNKLFYDSFQSNKGEINSIFLTGEDVFPYKKIGNCIGYFTYSFDTRKVEGFEDEKNNKGVKIQIPKLSKKVNTVEVYCFYYHVYDFNKLISFLQHNVPKIPIVNKIISKIPFLNNICFPKVRGVITTEDRILFKRDIVEIRGKSMIPLTVKPNFNTYSVIEYKGKFDETRKMERFIFSKDVLGSEFEDIINIAKNSVQIASQINPQVKVDQEKSIMKRG